MRIRQILDAALHAFATDGFAATRIDDIARLAGLSKGGIYTHFKSKEEIFEALLTRSLTPRVVRGGELSLDMPVTVALLVEHIIDRMYDDLADSQTLLALRLLFADGSKVPKRVTQWRHAVVEPYLNSIEGLVRRGAAAGTLRRSVVADAPWLLIAPGLFSAMFQMAFEETTPAMTAEHRRAHVVMLYELLAPHAPA